MLGYKIILLIICKQELSEKLLVYYIKIEDKLTTQENFKAQ